MTSEHLEALEARCDWQALKREALRIEADRRACAADRTKARAAACRACTYLDEFYAAAEHAEAGLLHATETGDLVSTAKLHFGLAVSCIWIGDLPRAEENLRTFLALGDPPVDGLQRGKALYNLGIVMCHRHRYREAVQFWVDSADLFRALGDLQREATAYLDAGRAETCDGKLVEAQHFLDQAQRLLSLQPNPHLEGRLLTRRAHLLHRQGELATSNQTCHDVLATGRAGIAAEHRAEAMWIMAENALASDRTAQAQLFMHLAYRYSLEHSYPWIVNRLADLRCRVAKRADSQGRMTL